MVDIITKKDGPRREDVAAKRLINGNWPTIQRLADQISDGGYTRSRQLIANSKEQPRLDNLKIHILGSSPKALEPKPVLRISLNNRVVVMDENSGRQLEFLGVFLFRGEQKYFSLATDENGFHATVDAKIELLLEDLNGVIIESESIQNAFIEIITVRLELQR